MDMEADLGIDSIKRVEILGAMTDKFPDLPEMDQNDLAEMRTLGEIVQYVEGFAGGTNATATTATISSTVTRSTVVKKWLPRPDALDIELSIQGRGCIITDNGSKVCIDLTKALLEQGWKVFILRFPPSLVASTTKLPASAVIVKMDDASENALVMALDAIAQQATINGFIHLSHKADKSNAHSIRYNPSEMQLLKLVFLAAKHLQLPLLQTPELGRNFFVVLTYMDGQLGTAQSRYYELNQGGFSGLIKTLNLEWPQVFCRLIDLGPKISEKQSSHLIMDELFDPDLAVVEVGVSTSGRMTLVGQAREDGFPSTANDKITTSSVFLVSGGAKGVTAACLLPLARQYQCRFILLGRTEFSGREPDWAVACEDDVALKRRIMQDLQAKGEKPTPKLVNSGLRAIKSSREIRQTLDAIAQAGGQAEYLSVDVTDVASLAEKLPAAVSKLGSITGVIHGAGVLADKPINKKTEADFDAVISTKVSGLAAILTVVEPSNLQCLALFSSAAGFYGNTGQSDYAIANEILNKTAYQFRHFYPQCHVISFNWGPWDGGMVTPELKRYFKERNVEIIPIDEGAAIFAGECHPERQETIQLLVGSSMRADFALDTRVLQSYQIKTRLSVADNLFLKDHVIGGNPVLPSAAALSWMSNSCHKFYPELHFYQCHRFQVLKGIVFDGQQADDYHLVLDELEKSAETVRFQVTVSSMTSANKPIWHYKAEITLAKVVATSPIYVADYQNSVNQAGNALYHNGTLFHGPLFQAIDRVLNHSQSKLTLLCHLNAVDDKQQGQFPDTMINPFATDLVFQAMLVWVREYRGMGSLPLTFAEATQYHAIPVAQPFYLSLEVNATSETHLNADVILHDAEGQVSMRFSGAEVTMSASLNELFTKK